MLDSYMMLISLRNQISLNNLKLRNPNNPNSNNKHIVKEQIQLRLSNNHLFAPLVVVYAYYHLGVYLSLSHLFPFNF